MATNEELQALNRQLEERNEGLARLNADLQQVNTDLQHLVDNVTVTGPVSRQEFVRDQVHAGCHRDLSSTCPPTAAAG